MPKQREGLEQLLVEDLQDLFDAEKQLVRAIPKMAKAVSDEELESALREHLEVTKGQVQRLERIFESMDLRAKGKPCKGMKGIVEEGQEQLEEDREESTMDSAIAAAARKVEHYEMAGYESARAVARQLGMRDAVEMLDQTLREEMEADKTLAQIGRRLLQESGQASAKGKSRSTSRRKPVGGRAKPSSAQSGAARGSSEQGGSRPLTDREEIRQWAEARRATPTCVRGTGSRKDTGLLRLDFPGYTGADSLEEISWDDWFDKFEERGLALLVQDTTSGGKRSNFNKLVSRESLQEPKTRTAG